MTLTSPPHRCCRRCGSTTNVRMIPGLLGPDEWQCVDPCELASDASDGAITDEFWRMEAAFAAVDGGERS